MNKMSEQHHRKVLLISFHLNSHTFKISSRLTFLVQFCLFCHKRNTSEQNGVNYQYKLHMKMNFV